MAQLTIRDIDEDVISTLERRAVQHGSTLERELRQILFDATKEEMFEHPVTSPSYAVKRRPSPRIAGKGKTLGNLIDPIVDESDWECLN